ncbi:hypothetical protein [Rhodanobacter denitrificans]|nr:hypothetical protein [Rhodanobacter denitrificans]
MPFPVRPHVRAIVRYINYVAQTMGDSNTYFARRRMAPLTWQHVF